MFDIIGKRNWFFLLSACVTIPGLIFILLTPLTHGAAGLKFSIDYTGGTLWEIHFKNAQPTPGQVKAVLVAQGLPDSQVSSTSGGYLLIRTSPIGLEPPAPQAVPPTSAPGASGTVSSPGASGSPASASAAPSASPAGAAAGTSPTPSVAPSPTPVTTSSGFPVPSVGKLGELATALQAKFGPIDGIRQETTVGPIISSELIQQAFLLVIFGALGILTWVSVRFHDVKFGASAIVALIHDVIVVVGTFAVLGTFFNVQIDSLFVTAMLTVIGFSVHDTIVVFDRIRENRARHAGEPFAAIVNHSILQTLGRSLNTSMTVIVTLLALLFFGASTIQDFVLALLLGILTGTYSSIFNASPILVVWHEWEDRRRGEAIALARAAR